MGELLIVLLIGILLVIFILGSSRSRNYRDVLVDLFVAGRIRQIAESKDIDLTEEYESFKLFIKKRRLRTIDLGEAIEDDLKEELLDDENLFKEKLSNKKNKKE